MFAYWRTVLTNLVTVKLLRHPTSKNSAFSLSSAGNPGILKTCLTELKTKASCGYDYSSCARLGISSSLKNVKLTS